MVCVCSFMMRWNLHQFYLWPRLKPVLMQSIIQWIISADLSPSGWFCHIPTPSCSLRRKHRLPAGRRQDETKHGRKVSSSQWTGDPTCLFRQQDQGLTKPGLCSDSSGVQPAEEQVLSDLWPLTSARRFCPQEAVKVFICLHLVQDPPVCGAWVVNNAIFSPVPVILAHLKLFLFTKLSCGRPSWIGIGSSLKVHQLYIQRLFPEIFTRYFANRVDSNDLCQST